MFVNVVEYNPDWAEKFLRESESLKSVFADLVVHIHHIGSTAVPGLAAKPIIDILLEVTDLQGLDAQTHLIDHLDYEAMGECGIPRRRYFRKGGDYRTHQIHAFASGDPHVKRHLAFRDYLIAHEEVARAYGDLKAKIAPQSNHDIEKYCDLKDPFIKLHERKALDWYDSLG